MFALADVLLILGLVFGVSHLYKTIEPTKVQKVYKDLPKRCLSCDREDGFMVREGKVECLFCGSSQ